MGLSISIVRRTVIGNMRMVIATVDFDSTYPTGGESLTLTDLGLNNIEFIMAEPNSGYVFQYDHANQKLKAYYGNYDQSSDGALTEVANGGDLSSVTGVRVIAIGR